MSVQAGMVAGVLGGRSVLGRVVRSVRDLMTVVEAGLPVQALDAVIARLGLPGVEATELKYRVVPRSTLARRHARLAQEESERLERLARLIALAEYVWESRDLAREFLMSAQPQLAGERPVDLIRSELAARQVEDLLNRIEHALPA